MASESSVHSYSPVGESLPSPPSVALLYTVHPDNLVTSETLGSQDTWSTEAPLSIPSSFYASSSLGTASTDFPGSVGTFNTVNYGNHSPLVIDLSNLPDTPPPSVPFQIFQAPDIRVGLNLRRRRNWEEQNPNPYGYN